MRSDVTTEVDTLQRLIIATARAEAQARSEAFAATQCQLDELTVALSEIVKAHIKLRDTLVELLG
jgi:hypothetical protein